MQTILANCLHSHKNKHEAWWVKVKVKPKEDAGSLLPTLDEAPGEYCLSKLLGISMHDLGEVLMECTLAKRKWVSKETLSMGMVSNSS
jgi:hypothetical protein